MRPGAYAIEASIGGPDRPEDRRAREAAFIPIRVADSDAEDLVVTLSKGVDVPGRIVLEDPTQQLPQVARLRIHGHGTARRRFPVR